MHQDIETLSTPLLSLRASLDGVPKSMRKKVKFKFKLKIKINLIHYFVLIYLYFNECKKFKKMHQNKNISLCYVI